MVERVFSIFRREINGLHEAAYLLGFFAVLSQLLALARDRLFAAAFGASSELDIYFAAFRIPDLILIVGASLVATSILIPFLIEKLDESREEGKRFIDGVFTVFFLGIIVASAAAFIAAPFLLARLFPGFTDEETQKTLILLTRIMLLQPVLLGLSNLLGSITQTFRRFFVYAATPLLYNIGIIAGILLLYPRFGMAGLGMGVVLGALLHLLVQVPSVAHEGMTPRFTARLAWGTVARLAAVSLPRTAALGAQNIAILVLLSLASLIGTGSIAVFNLAWNLQSVPLAIIGASYSIAAFPTLSRLFRLGSAADFTREVGTAVRHIVFLSLPVAVLFIVLRAQIVRSILGAGEFGWSDTRLVAASLALFAVSVVMQSLVVLFVRAFYAVGDTRTPLFINVFASALAVLFGIILLRSFAAFPLFRHFMESLLRVSDVPGTEVLMLPLAYSTALGINCALFMRAMRRKFGSALPSSGAFLQNLSASVIMGFFTFFFLSVFDDVFALTTGIGIFLQGLASGLLGLSVWAAVLSALGNRELSEMWQTFHRKIWKAKPVGPDATEPPL